MTVKGMLAVAPSNVQVGEPFALRVKVRGDLIAYPAAARSSLGCRRYSLRNPFSSSPRGGVFLDDCSPGWQGEIAVDGGDALEAPERIVFDGENQGVFLGDTRPIVTARGFRFTKPGFHFIRLADAESGVEAWSNPVRVTEHAPDRRLYWGDPHWQTFFSDGLRIPEELFAFARDEGFLDFGALADHVEPVTDLQWDYQVAVTNLFNEPGRFATLIGQEWTHKELGHRNIYYRGDHGPVLRCTDPGSDTLPRLWAALDRLMPEALAIPHHTANVVMGVDWSHGWNPRYEKAVEICSVWGSSEKPADMGNTMPIRNHGGEVKGRHVIDALERGCRFGFVGGGDIHDGRPGDEMHNVQEKPETWPGLYKEGFTGAFAPALTRENVYDAMKTHQTIATTKSRIYLDTRWDADGDAAALSIEAASEEGIAHASVVSLGREVAPIETTADRRVIETSLSLPVPEGENACYYVHIETEAGNQAWSSPWWGPDDAEARE